MTSKIVVILTFVGTFVTCHYDVCGAVSHSAKTFIKYVFFYNIVNIVSQLAKIVQFSIVIKMFLF